MARPVADPVRSSSAMIRSVPAWPSTPRGGHQMLAAAHPAGLARGEGLAEVPHRVQEASGVVHDTRRRLVCTWDAGRLESCPVPFGSEALAGPGLGCLRWSGRARVLVCQLT
jgi:hypothetical protein